MKRSGALVVGLVGLVGAALAACGGSSASKADGGGDGSGGGSDGSGTACADYVQTSCARLQACAPGIFLSYGFATMADCTANYLPGCKDTLAAPHSGDTPALVQQCGDQLAAMTCTDFLQGQYPAACLPQGGTISDGGSCNTDWQCASGRCFPSASPLSCGTCVPAVPLGQPCLQGFPLGGSCADNLVCAVTPAGGNGSVCTRPAAIGDACLDPEVCPANAYCDPSTNVCTQLPGLGQPCGLTIGFCDPTKPATQCDYKASVCKPLALAKPGEPCGLIDDTFFRCVGNSECFIPADAGADQIGTCGPPDLLLEGEPCPGSASCISGTSCSGGVCTAALVCGGAGAAGNDAATDAGPAAGSAFARRKLIRLPGTPTPPAFRTRH